MQVFSCGHSYLKRDSRDSQISFCFTVFQEKSSSSKAKRVRTVILHLFNHVDSFFRPWTKRMQYPILGRKEKKKKLKKRYQKLYSSTLVYMQDHSVLHLLHNYRLFGLIIFSGLTNSNSTAVFLKSPHNCQIKLNDRPGCQKYSSVHNTTQHNGSLHQPAEGSCFSEQQAKKASCNNSNIEHYLSSMEVKSILTQASL